MTVTTETYDGDWKIQRNRRVKKLANGLYYVQQFEQAKNYRGNSQSMGDWRNVSKGYAHSTSCFAALGRMVNKDHNIKR